MGYKQILIGILKQSQCLPVLFFQINPAILHRFQLHQSNIGEHFSKYQDRLIFILIAFLSMTRLE